VTCILLDVLARDLLQLELRDYVQLRASGSAFVVEVGRSNLLRRQQLGAGVSLDALLRLANVQFSRRRNN
jgi:hypothetical protein